MNRCCKTSIRPKGLYVWVLESEWIDRSVRDCDTVAWQQYGQFLVMALIPLSRNS